MRTISENLSELKRDKQKLAEFIAKSNPSLVCAAAEIAEVLRELEKVARVALNTSATHDGMKNCELLAKARAALNNAEN